MPGAQSDCEDCGNSFPLAAEHSDLCRKCKRLAPLTQSSEKYKEILVRFLAVRLQLGFRAISRAYNLK